MRVGRLRTGELLGLVGAVGVLVVLFLEWFSVTLDTLAMLRSGGGDAEAVDGLVRAGEGWPALGWIVDALLLVAVLGALGIAYLTVVRAAPAAAVGLALLTGVVGTCVFVVLLVRVVTLADDSAFGGAFARTVSLPAYLGLAFAALIPVGAWIALRDERLDAPESAYTPPPARPVPGT